MRKIVFFIFSVMVTGACTSIDCPVNNRVYTVYNLMKADGTKDTLKVDTLTISTTRADGSDTILLSKATGIFTFEMDISYTQPEDELHLTLLDTLGNTYRDTISIKKDNYPHFESVDCQVAYFHNLTDVHTTQHIIDSVVIKNSNVNYNATNEHFHIYFKARY